MNISIN